MFIFWQLCIGAAATPHTSVTQQNMICCNFGSFFIHDNQDTGSIWTYLTLSNITLALIALRQHKPQRGILVEHIAWKSDSLGAQIFSTFALISSSSDFFFVRAAHRRQECLFEASQLLPSLLRCRRGWVGGGRGGHVGHGLDDLGHKMGMACQLNLPSGVRDNCGKVLDNEGKSSRFQPAMNSSNKKTAKSFSSAQGWCWWW